MDHPVLQPEPAPTDAAYHDDAGFLRSVLAASGDCIKVLDLDANLIYMTEGGQKIMEVSDFNAIRGCPWPDFWQDQGNLDALEAIAVAKAGGIGRFQGMANTMAGNARFWDVQVTPILGPDGLPERLLSVSRDISDSRRDQIELTRIKDRLELALRAGKLGYWEYDKADDTFAASDICKENFGRDPAQPFAFEQFNAAVHPDDRAHYEVALAQALQTGSQLDIQYRIKRPDDSVGWVLLQAQVDLSRTEPHMAGISLDITAYKREEEDRRLQSLELNHRIKNQMAVVQSIVNQTLRGAYPLETAKTIIGERLGTLSRAHDLLIQGRGERASIQSIIATSTQLLDARRVRLKGPDMAIGPKAALSLSLILHELSTNAIKYGAFSVPGGVVEITWGEGELDDQPAFEISFVEMGGPPVSAPAGRGFGSRLLQAGLSGSVSRASVDYHPSGLQFRLAAVLATVISES